MYNKFWKKVLPSPTEKKAENIMQRNVTLTAPPTSKSVSDLLRTIENEGREKA